MKGILGLTLIPLLVFIWVIKLITAVILDILALGEGVIEVLSEWKRELEDGE